jgi:IMP dehydrogenase
LFINNSLSQRYKQGFITNPQCIKETDTVRDLMSIKAQYGFTGTPVTDTGRVGGKLIGLCVDLSILNIIYRFGDVS